MMALSKSTLKSSSDRPSCCRLPSLTSHATRTAPSCAMDSMLWPCCELRIIVSCIREPAASSYHSKNRLRASTPLLRSTAFATPCAVPLSKITVTSGMGYCRSTRKKCFAPLNVECFVSSYKQKEITKTRRNLEENTFVTTKSARRLKNKSAHMMNATKTAAFHSVTMKEAKLAMKIILKTGLKT